MYAKETIYSVTAEDEASGVCYCDRSSLLKKTYNDTFMYMYSILAKP